MEGLKSKHVSSLSVCLCFYLFCVSPFGFIIDYFWFVYALCVTNLSPLKSRYVFGSCLRKDTNLVTYS